MAEYLPSLVLLLFLTACDDELQVVRGLDCGDCREPFGRLTEEQKAYVEKVVKENMEA